MALVVGTVVLSGCAVSAVGSLDRSSPFPTPLAPGLAAVIVTPPVPGPRSPVAATAGPLGGLGGGASVQLGTPPRIVLVVRWSGRAGQIHGVSPVTDAAAGTTGTTGLATTGRPTAISTRLSHDRFPLVGNVTAPPTPTSPAATTTSAAAASSLATATATATVTVIPTVTAPPTPTPAVRIMFLGDSIAQGQTIAGYRRYLVDYLIRLRGVNVDAVGSQDTQHPAELVESQHEGHSGLRADEVAAGAVAPGGWLTTYRPEVVLEQVGTNDALQFRDGLATALKVAALVSETCGLLPGVKVVLGAVPPLGQGRARARARAESINAALPPALALLPTSCQATLVDAGRSLDITTDLSDDTVHPTAAGYKKMAAVYAAVVTSDVQSVLNDRRSAG